MSKISSPTYQRDEAEMRLTAWPALVFALLAAMLMVFASLSPASAGDEPAEEKVEIDPQFPPNVTTINNYLPARDAKGLPPAPYVPPGATGPAPDAAATPAPTAPVAAPKQADAPAPSKAAEAQLPPPAPKTAAVGPEVLPPAGGAKPATSMSSENQPIRGVIRPSAQAAITTDLAARVSKVGFKAGQNFRAGEVLVSFDCARQKAEMTSAEALQREMSAAYRSAQILYQHKAGARLDVETAKARLDRASADLDGNRQRLAQCTIIAPYDGSVVDLQVHEFEMPTPGKPLLSIVSRKDPEIELVVPSTWLTWLTPGTSFDFFVEETGKSYPAKVQRLGATADTVSQTLKVFATFSSQAPAILPGSSGTAKFTHDKG